ELHPFLRDHGLGGHLLRISFDGGATFERYCISLLHIDCSLVLHVVGISLSVA
ncbi:hypothetical protein LINGRAHAP2_LOCUS30601, partial [Linum grandiflorum]